MSRTICGQCGQNGQNVDEKLNIQIQIIPGRDHPSRNTRPTPNLWTATFHSKEEKSVDNIDLHRLDAFRGR